MMADPTFFDEAIKEEAWTQAMNEEIQAIKKNNMWELVELPQGKSPIELKWIYRTKFYADGSI